MVQPCQVAMKLCKVQPVAKNNEQIRKDEQIRRYDLFLFAYCLPIETKGLDFGRWRIIRCQMDTNSIAASYELGSETLSLRLEQISLRQGFNTQHEE